MNEKDKKIMIDSLTMTICRLNDATESFVSECFDLRKRLENLKPFDNNHYEILLQRIRHGFVNIACLCGIIFFIQVTKVIYPNIPPIIWWILVSPLLIYFLISLILIMRKKNPLWTL